MAQDIVTQGNAGPRQVDFAHVHAPMNGQTLDQLAPLAPPSDAESYALGRRGVPLNEPVLAAEIERFDENQSRKALELSIERATLNRNITGLGVRTHLLTALVFGILIFASALWVDYHIVREFWTRVLANEFLEVPPELADSVIFKSMQVVFATLAVHFLLRSIGKVGRAIFAGFVCLLAIAMVWGIGILVANDALPAGAKLFGVNLSAESQGVDDTLAALGLAPADEAAAAADDLDRSTVESAQTMIWLGSLSAIFLIVTGVGALALHSAVGSFQDLTGGEGSQSRDRRIRVQYEHDFFTDAQARVRLVHTRIADALASYVRGVIDSGANDREQKIAQAVEASEAVRKRWTTDTVRDRQLRDPLDLKARVGGKPELRAVRGGRA